MGSVAVSFDFPGTKTDPALLKALADAAGRPLPKEERFEQRVSWCWGQLGAESTLTKDQVREMLQKSIDSYTKDLASTGRIPDSSVPRTTTHIVGSWLLTPTTETKPPHDPS